MLGFSTARRRKNVNSLCAISMQEAGRRYTIFEYLLGKVSATRAMRTAIRGENLFGISVFTYHDGGTATPSDVTCSGPVKRTHSGVFRLITFFFARSAVLYPFDFHSNKCMHITFITRSIMLSRMCETELRIYLYENLCKAIKRFTAAPLLAMRCIKSVVISNSFGGRQFIWI